MKQNILILLSFISLLVLTSLLITVRQSAQLRKLENNLKIEINGFEEQRLLLEHEFQILTRLDNLQEISKNLSAIGYAGLNLSPPSRDRIISLNDFRKYTRKITSSLKVNYRVNTFKLNNFNQVSDIKYLRRKISGLPAYSQLLKGEQLFSINQGIYILSGEENEK